MEMSRTCGLVWVEDEEDKKEGGGKTDVPHVEAHHLQYVPL